MVLSLIDATPMASGWGNVYQSGAIASLELEGSVLPTDRLIVSMSGDENWFQHPCLQTFMEDNDTTVLSDAVLTAFVDAIIAFLKNGVSVLIHCNEGKYRSTYMDVAVHMRVKKMSAAQAFELVKAHHPIAALRAGTDEQLRRLEAIW